MNREEAGRKNSFGGYSEAASENIEREELQDRPRSALGVLRNRLLNPYLTLISRLVLGGVFVLSGMTKLGVPQTFATSINSYEMPLPKAVVDIMAVGLPPLELGLGIWLLVGLFTRFSAVLSGGLVLVFLLALVQAMFRGLEPNCGCFAAGPEANALGTAMVEALGPVGEFLTNEKVGPGVIIRDLTFLLMSAHLFFVPAPFALDRLRSRGRVVEEYEEEEVEAGWEEAEEAAPAR